MVFALSVFFVSLICTIALFTLKRWELASGRTLIPALRARADERALHIKELALAARLDLAKVPPALVRFGRTLLHEFALATARFLRAAEHHAYRVADLVSHKRRYERRETRSEFLKKVSEHRNGGVEGEQ